MDRNDLIVACVDMLCEAFRQKPTAETYQAYSYGLDGIDEFDVQNAVQEAIKLCQWMPSVAELRSLCGAKLGLERRMLEWRQNDVRQFKNNAKDSAMRGQLELAANQLVAAEEIQSGEKFSREDGQNRFQAWLMWLRARYPQEQIEAKPEPKKLPPPNTPTIDRPEFEKNRMHVLKALEKIV